MKGVVTRFPPSPTGFFHIGSARTALFNYLFTKKMGGTMYLRFEDTDKARSKKEYEEDILSGLEWLKIEYSLPEPFRQSERTALYKTALQKLIDAGVAYVSKEPAKDDAAKEVSVVRLRNPGTRITFTDIIRGEVSFDTAELKDFVIARSIDDPLYNFSVVVDDAAMGVSHVIRGEDHISNTPRQILLLEALGFARPQYAHIPLILAPDRSKMSKRHGAVSITEYRRAGFLSEALVNYLALLGWNPGGEQEIFSREELIERFDLEKAQKGGAIFDIEKLKWFNGEHQKRLSVAQRQAYALAVLPQLREKIQTRGLVWNEEVAKSFLTNPVTNYTAYEPLLADAEKGSLDYLFAEPDAAPERIPQKGTAPHETIEYLSAVKEAFMKLGLDDFGNADRIKNAVWDYATEKGRGKVLWPLRYALSGEEKSQDPFVIATYIGKERAVARIEKAIEKLRSV